MKRTLPLLITAISGIVLIVAFFVPSLEVASEETTVWFDVLASIAFVLGGGNLLKLQLQKVSDRQPGWGYAAVTVIAFVLTLVFGLLKTGSPPEASSEYFGETFASLPVSALPEYRVPGEIPQRADGAPLPASAREQLRQADGELIFQGWMSPGQQADLTGYEDTLSWRCQVEQLAAVARPPASLRGKVNYYVGQHALAWRGTMTDEQQSELRRLLQPGPDVENAIAQLATGAHKESSLAVTDVPSGFQIPPAQNSIVELTDSTLRFTGPMSVGEREQLAKGWCHYPPARPQTESQQQQLLAALNQAGPPLNEKQRELFDRFMEAEWKAELLVLALNSAGSPPPTPVPVCETRQAILAGETPPAPTATAPVLLNAAQIAVIQRFVDDSEISPEQLPDLLAAAGPFTESQREAVGTYFAELPTLADRYQELGFVLLQNGSLSNGQRELLFAPAREQFRWRQQVGRLFLAAHEVKYPWSGDYSAGGTPFWWIYEYIFQPLLTTTFAVLAFYVASAAFRAFRAKNLEATLLLGTAFIILLGRTAAGAWLTGWLPESLAMFRIDQLTVYIMSIFNTAGNRAIMIGIALGIASTSLRVLLGIDRSYLGSGDD
ncbi:hypothetical protein [Planctomicrobium sp. SH664]|uniref:hypothetical protein n=1 Tax=Planctomicrobium sp. SH664 TaxID=3448125 RepID=UPI003F5BFEED